MALLMSSTYGCGACRTQEVNFDPQEVSGHTILHRYGGHDNNIH